MKMKMALKAKNICKLMLVDHELSPLHSLIQQRQNNKKGKKDTSSS